VATLFGRLDEIVEAQRCGGPEIGMPQVTPFLLTGLYLDDADLEVIRPFLRPRDCDLDDLGEIGRYEGLPVFRKGNPTACPQFPTAEHRGIGFDYCPVGHVLM
jgi:hypothetical protein